MRVLVVGTGGREAAIGWTCSRHGHEVVTIPFAADSDVGRLDTDHIDLVIVGREAALVAGIADECSRRGVPCFGPTAELARLESSKGWARELAHGLGVPGPEFERFTSAAEAIAWFDGFDRPVVVKLDGLAGG